MTKLVDPLGEIERVRQACYDAGISCDAVMALARSAARTQARLNWAANELLACDYGDNNKGGIGWLVYGWRQPKNIPHEDRKRIYGTSINEAIDAELA